MSFSACLNLLVATTMGARKYKRKDKKMPHTLRNKNSKKRYQKGPPLGEKDPPKRRKSSKMPLIYSQNILGISHGEGERLRLPILATVQRHLLSVLATIQKIQLFCK